MDRTVAFKQTEEYKQSLKMRSSCDKVLKYVFGVNESSIIRYEKECGPHVLDQEFAIDLKVILPNKMQLSGQEKALTFRYYSYKTFTIEFYQNRHDYEVQRPDGTIMKPKEPGEWFKIASQFYLSGYSDKSGVRFIEWKIIKMFDFMLWQREQDIDNLEKKCRPCTNSHANFLPIRYKDIPLDCIYAEGNLLKKKAIIRGKIEDFAICK